MLRARQSLHYIDCGVIRLPEVQTLENGNAEVRMVDQSKSSLPDPSVTDLGDCIKAGVDLRQVPSKILGTQSVTIDTTPAPAPEDNEIPNKGE